MKILIVDDSVVFRSTIKLALSGIPDIEVTGTASNGKFALAKLETNPVDLIILDYEMPEMNGLETLRELRKKDQQTRVIVFSSQTMSGAEKALEALRNGADDVLPKTVNSGSSSESITEQIRADLLPKVLQFLAKGTFQPKPTRIEPLLSSLPGSVQKEKFSQNSLVYFKPEIILIGSSTGGPNALEVIFKELRMPVRCPILIVQHMPPVFTQCLAERLQEITKISAGEAKQMEVLRPGQIYMAPGDYHMTLFRDQGQIKLRLDQGPQRNSVRPAVDPLFETASEIYGNKCMGFILTGMGEDGVVGATAVKRCGGGIMIQNEASCVVYGMPGSVFEAGAYDAIGDLQQIGAALKRFCA